MGGPCRGFVLDAGIAQGRKIHAFEESLPGAEQNWRYGYVHLIDKAVAKILLDDVDSATYANIFAIGSFAGAFKCDGNASRHKMEGGAPVHDKRRAYVVGQHEYRHVINRIIAPPTPPALVWPWTPNRPEHIPAEDPCANIQETSNGKVIVDARFAAFVTKHLLLKSSSGERPTMKRRAANTQWIINVLIWASAETV